MLQAQVPADPTKALNAGAQAFNAGAQSVEAGAREVEAGTQSLSKTWAMVSPYVWWVLLALGIALAVFIGWKLWGWWQRRRAAAPVAGGPPPMSPGRLLQVRRTFLSGLPWANRAAVVDLPTVVVLGPAGGGKTQLIGLDVDWQRQARQFLPSFTADPLLQVYLGPDCVVHEVSAPLLEDDSLAARTALRRMWRKCFGRRQKGLAAIVLDVRWLADTPPDEQRRMAQLLRGKLNLISESCGAAVETRVCLTHMDTLEGFEDFARLLKKNGAALSFDIPRQGEEDRLGSLLGGQEQYLALGLTSLSVDAFERLERFYSQGGRSFEGLGRFVSALQEGNTLSYTPRLTRVYLSSPTPEARASGTLWLATEDAGTESLRKRYLQTHLRRAVLGAVVLCLPVLAAYVNYYLYLGEAREQMEDFERTVTQMRERGQEGRGEVVEQKVTAAAEALDRLLHAERWWPPLGSGFGAQRLDLRQRLARGIRDSHLRPALERCHKQPQDCRPEQVVHLLAILHAAKGDVLGNFINPQARPHFGGAGAPAATNVEKSRNWITALNLRESLVHTYVLASDKPWEPERPCRVGAVDVPGAVDDDWACWPFRERLTFEGQLKPWLDHLLGLRRTLEAGPKELAQLNDRREERERLQAQLADLDVYAKLSTVLNLIDASPMQVKTHQFQGIETTVKVLHWLQANRDALAAMLNMEAEAYTGYLAVEKMSAPELLTRDGLWLVGNNTGPYRVELLQQSFDFRPLVASRGLLRALIDQYEKNNRLGGVSQADLYERELNRTSFETDLKPLVEDFTQRMKNIQLPNDESAKREEYVQKQVRVFAQRYREDLFDLLHSYRFDAERSELLDELSRHTQPSSRLVDVLREVADRANLEPLESPYYEPLRNAVAPFKPLVQLMTVDKSGTYTALAPYHALVAQMHDGLDVVSKAAKEKAEGEGKEKKAEGEGPRAEGAGGTTELADVLTPLEKMALSMLLEEEGSHLRKVNEWLDQQSLTAELRQPFLKPFLRVQALGKRELERTLAKQWEEVSGRMLRGMLDRYPFNPEAREDVDPSELEVLRLKDGAFWHFVNQTFSRVCVERGAQWTLRGPLREKKLELPEEMLLTMSRLSRLARLLWDEEGRPRPLMLKVQPQPLPAPPPMTGVFITMSSLKCGKTTAYGFNQVPTWQDFPLSWWDQQVSSIVLELRSPARDFPQFLSLPWNRSAWSCFRLFEEATVTSAQRRQWSLALQGNDASKREVEISFGLKGEPWAPFREVPR